MAAKKLSTLDTWAQDFNVKCLCPRDNVAVYFCNVPECKDKKEKFYCMQCKAEDDKHITHKAIPI